MSKPGQTNNPNGRPVGAANKRNQEIREYAEKKGVNPAHILIDILAGEKDALGFDAFNDPVPVDKNDKKWAIDTLMPFMYAKRKPADADGDDSRGVIDDILDAIDGNR